MTYPYMEVEAKIKIPLDIYWNADDQLVIQWKDASGKRIVAIIKAKKVILDDV